MAFIINPTPTRAYRRLGAGETVCETFDELLALQDRIQCDIYITSPTSTTSAAYFSTTPE